MTTGPHSLQSPQVAGVMVSFRFRTAVNIKNQERINHKVLEALGKAILWLRMRALKTYAQ